MEGYLETKEFGIIPCPTNRIFKSIFCRHKRTIIGTACSKTGTQRSSGKDMYLVCLECGKVLAEHHFAYWRGENSCRITYWRGRDPFSIAIDTRQGVNNLKKEGERTL